MGELACVLEDIVGRDGGGCRHRRRGDDGDVDGSDEVALVSPPPSIPISFSSSSKEEGSIVSSSS